jgi:hypothetical protein
MCHTVQKREELERRTSDAQERANLCAVHWMKQTEFWIFIELAET